MRGGGGKLEPPIKKCKKSVEGIKETGGGGGGGGGGGELDTLIKKCKKSVECINATWDFLTVPSKDHRGEMGERGE